MNILEKFHTARRIMKSSLIERDEEIDMILYGLLSGEHVLLIGAPGVAKSMLVDSMMRWMSDATKASILMNRNTELDELLGPVSIRALNAEQYWRETDGFAPSVDLLFMDEIWEGSSSANNAVLKILNEKTFRNGSKGVIDCPLKLCLAASNLWPYQREGGGHDVTALYDRFLLRKEVRTLKSFRSWDKLLSEKTHVPEFPEESRLSNAELETARKEVEAVEISSEMREIIHKLRGSLAGNNIALSPRRWFRSMNVIRASAWLRGHTTADKNDIAPLQYVLWYHHIEEAAKVYDAIVAIAAPAKAEIDRVDGARQEIDNNTHMDEMGSLQAGIAKLRDLYNRLSEMEKDDIELDRIKEVKERIHESGNRLRRKIDEIAESADFKKLLG